MTPTRRTHPVRRGAVIGMLIGVAYAVVGLGLAFVENGIGDGEGLYDDISNPWDVIRETALGLALYGVFVIPLGAALGALVARRSHRRSHQG